MESLLLEEQSSTNYQEANQRGSSIQPANADQQSSRDAGQQH
nr:MULTISPECIES: hypothetical protein [unclassified Pseudomonas]